MRRKLVAPSVSVSEMETEASVIAMAEEMERVHDLPGESEGDMGWHGHCSATVPGGMTRYSLELIGAWVKSWARRHYQARHGNAAVPTVSVPCCARASAMPGRPFEKLYRRQHEGWSRANKVQAGMARKIRWHLWPRHGPIRLGPCDAGPSACNAHRA